MSKHREKGRRDEDRKQDKNKAFRKRKAKLKPISKSKYRLDKTYYEDYSDE